MSFLPPVAHFLAVLVHVQRAFQLLGAALFLRGRVPFFLLLVQRLKLTFEGVIAGPGQLVGVQTFGASNGRQMQRTDAGRLTDPFPDLAAGRVSACGRSGRPLHAAAEPAGPLEWTEILPLSSGRGPRQRNDHVPHARR